MGTCPGAVLSCPPSYISMETIELTANIRERIGKEGSAKVRQSGMVPAVLYGDEAETRALAIDDATFQKLLRKAGNRFVLLNIKVQDKGGEKVEPAIIKSIQRHPVSDHVIHIDFLRVSLKKKVNVNVPVHVEGIAPGTIEGGVLQTTSRTVAIRCLPNQVPDFVVADVSSLNIGGVLHAGDLKLPEGVELHTAPVTTIVSVVAIRVEEEAAATPAEGEAGAVAAAPGAEPAQPEVIGEKEREERKLKKGEEKLVKEAEKKEIKEARKAEDGKKK